MVNDASIVGHPVAPAFGTFFSNLVPRVISLAVLAAVSSGLTYGVAMAVRAARDAFVAPAILSPDNDLVLASKIKLGELSVERERARAELESLDSNVAADDAAIVRLADLKGALDKSRRFTAELTSGKAAASAAELQTLAEQRRVISEMREDQAERARRAEADARSGLVTRTDAEKETRALDEIHLALIDNARATSRSQADLRETALTQRALAGSDAPLTPELADREDQAIHVDLETLRLEADRRSKEAQRGAVAARIEKIDELEAELRRRPVFRAVEGRVDLAFVPYTQIESVKPAASVYSCVWGLFFCKEVGTVHIACEWREPTTWKMR